MGMSKEIKKEINSTQKGFKGKSIGTKRILKGNQQESKESRDVKNKSIRIKRVLKEINRNRNQTELITKSIGIKRNLKRNSMDI